MKVAPGIVAMSPVVLTVEDCNGYDVRLEATAEPAAAGRTGRFVCSRLEVTQRKGGPPVTLAGIRSLPVAGMTKHAAAQFVMSVDGQNKDGSVTLSALVMPEDVASKGPTDSALWWVAHIYRLALVAGDPPTKAVQQAMELAPATAGRWVAMARERGLLEASEGPGKAGG